VPGQVFDGFGASGLTLTGGAAIQTTTLADGTTDSFLDLPAGRRRPPGPASTNPRATELKPRLLGCAAIDAPPALMGCTRHRLSPSPRSDAQIAQPLFITPETVETHLVRAYRKLGLSGRGELTSALAREAETSPSQTDAGSAQRQPARITAPDNDRLITAT
jgi:hypothetical protein